MSSSLPVFFFSSFTSSLGCHSATIRKTEPRNGHFALRVLAESQKLFLCVDNVTQKSPIKGRGTLGDYGLRLERMGQCSRGGMDGSVSGLI